MAFFPLPFLVFAMHGNAFAIFTCVAFVVVFVVTVITLIICVFVTVSHIVIFLGLCVIVVFAFRIFPLIAFLLTVLRTLLFRVRAISFGSFR
jgi:hypothetical protein